MIQPPKQARPCYEVCSSKSIFHTLKDPKIGTDHNWRAEEDTSAVLKCATGAATVEFQTKSNPTDQISISKWLKRCLLHLMKKKWWPFFVSPVIFGQKESNETGRVLFSRVKIRRVRCLMSGTSPTAAAGVGAVGPVSDQVCRYLGLFRSFTSIRANSMNQLTCNRVSCFLVDKREHVWR